MSETRVRSRSRRNGWGWPPHILQLTSWILILYLSVLQFALIAIAFQSLVTKIVLSVIMGLMIGFLVIVKITVTTIDPADFAVETKVRERPQPNFDRSQHAHVIQDDYFCNICEEIVHPSSKHCRQCNKCVLDFDHHCKWLNNCVGAKNYKWFLIFVGITVLTCAAIALQSITAFSLFFAQPNVLERGENNMLMIFGVPVADNLWLGFLVSTFVTSILIAVLTGHLLVFHVKLLKRGVTTYNFIMDQRKSGSNNNNTKNFGNGSIQNGNIPPAPPPPNSGWLSGLKTKIGVAKSVKAPDQNANGMPLSSSIRNQTSNSSVPKLPPISNVQREIKRRAPLSQNSAFVDPSDLPYVEIENSSHSSTDSIETKSVGTNFNHHNDIQLNKLPPIKRPTTSRKLYEPHFESVLMAERELTLPSIMVTNSDSDTLLEQSMTEIPLQAMREQAKVEERDFPPGSTVYITQGQFTVTKITTPPASAKTSSRPSQTNPIKFNVSGQEQARFVEKGVGHSSFTQPQVHPLDNAYNSPFPSLSSLDDLSDETILPSSTEPDV